MVFPAPAVYTDGVIWGPVLPSDFGETVMIFRLQLTSILVGLMAFTAVCRGQSQEIVSALPARTAALVTIKNLREASEKLDQWARLMQTPAPTRLESFVPGGSMEALRDDGSMAFVWMMDDAAQETGEPDIALIPVDDYAAFAQQLEAQDPSQRVTEAMLEGQTILMGQRGAFAVLADVEQRTELEQILDQATAIPESLQPLQDWVEQQDMVGVLLPRGVEKVLASMEQSLAEVPQGFSELEEFEEGAHQQDMFLQTTRMYAQWLEAAHGKVTLVAGGVRFQQEAVRLSGQVRLQSDDSQAHDGALAQQDGTELLELLPSGPYLMAITATVPNAWAKPIAELSAQSFRVGIPGADQLPAEQQEELSREVEKQMEGVKGFAFVMGVPAAGGGMYNRSYGVMKVVDADEYLQRAFASTKLVGQLFEDAASTMVPEYEVSQEEIEGRGTVKAVMDFSQVWPADDAFGQQTQAMIQSMFGPGGKLITYVVAVDETTAAVAYDTADGVKRVIESATSGGNEWAEDRQLQTTLELLPERRYVTLLVSLQGMRDYMSQMVANVLGGAQGPGFPPFPVSPPIGVAVGGDRQSVEAQVVMPAETLEAMGMFIQNMQQRFSQPPVIQ